MRTDKISSYLSLSMLLVMAETMLPHPVPFLRYGLANIPLLIALSDLGKKEYLYLALLKGITGSLLSGTLFSPIGLMSIAQSTVSGLVMLLLYTALKERVTFWGISTLGAVSSTLVQMHLGSLYLGKGMMTLLPVALIFSLLSGLLTALLAMKTEIREVTTEEKDEGKSEGTAYLIMLLLVTLLSGMIRSITLLALLFSAGLLAMKIRGKKLLLLPWVNILLISLLSALLVPRGEVLIRLLGFPLTRESLAEGIRNALQISTMVSFSLAFSGSIIMKGIIGETFRSFSERQKAFFATEGKLSEKIKSALQTKK